MIGKRISDFDIYDGYFTDHYFNRAAQIAAIYYPDKVVRMQFFCKKKAMLCGIDEAREILGEQLGRGGVRSLPEGSMIEPWETVMTIEGKYHTFAHLETIILGLLSRRTRIATNAFNVKEAAGDKEVFFYPARFDIWHTQAGDGYAAALGGVDAVSTDAQGELVGWKGTGTMPHALIALFDGDTARATVAFAKMFPRERCVSLVDFNNNCPWTALDVAQAMRAEGLPLHGVRLDTSENMVDESLQGAMGSFKPTGVCKELVWNTRKRLDINGFESVKIFVSGGFTVEKIKEFERAGVPVDGYGVGSSMLDNRIDFTADIVSVLDDGEWVPRGKTGREYRPNPKMFPR
jgi:nicotinate phosphoribosyltransferase